MSRSKVWIAGHTHADGRPVKPQYAETIVRILELVILFMTNGLWSVSYFVYKYLYQEQIQSLDSQMEFTSADNIKEGAVSKILEKDKPGWVRGFGRGITTSKIE